MTTRNRPLPSRRAVLVAASVATATTAATVAVGAVARRPAAGDARSRSGVLRSAALGRSCDWVVHHPSGSRPGDRLGVCVLLHGKGGDARSAARIGYPQVLDDLVAAGAPPFALAAVSGGNGYWHPRRHGGDSGRMVVDELLPLLAGLGLAATPQDRIGLLGWSMGGFGALLLARELGPARVAAVATASAALWTSAGRTAPGAFDDAEDYHRHDLFARPDAWRGIPVRLDCGGSDPFAAANRTLARTLRPAPVTGFGPGGHTNGYWRAVAPDGLRFVGGALPGITGR